MSCNFFDKFKYPHYYLTKYRQLRLALIGNFLETENNELLLTELNEPLEVEEGKS
jgi:hypothetical protein